jgi:hypothetical protein
MTEYDNTNRGAIFKNARKDRDTHPDYTGTLNANGTEYWVSAWIKEGRNGKFMSLSVKPKDDQPRQQSISQQAVEKIRKPDPISTGRARNDMDDEIPF